MNSPTPAQPVQGDQKKLHDELMSMVDRLLANRASLVLDTKLPWEYIKIETNARAALSARIKEVLGGQRIGCEHGTIGGECPWCKEE